MVNILSILMGIACIVIAFLIPPPGFGPDDILLWFPLAFWFIGRGLGVGAPPISYLPIKK